MSQYPNFNPNVDANTYPDLTITDTDAQAKSSPTKGDPGFIVSQPDGTWTWEPNLPAARSAAGTTGAIYSSWQVCDYFKQFAEEVQIDPKTGNETVLGPLEG